MSEAGLPETPPAALLPAAAGGEPGSRARNPYWTYLARLDSAESRRMAQGHLDRIAAVLLPAGNVPGRCAGEAVPWGLLRYEHTALLRAVLIAHSETEASKRQAVDARLLAALEARCKKDTTWQAPTVNAHLSALRGVIHEAWRLGYMSADERDRAKDIPNLKVSREPAGRDIRDEEIAAMLDPGAAPGPLEVRDTAVIAWLWSTGGRRAEAAGQLIENYRRRERAVKILGKGNKERTGFLHPDAAVYVGRWLALAGARKGPMFRPVDRWGNIVPRHLSPGTIGLIVQRRRELAGLEPLSTHDWRRTFVGDLLSAGTDLVSVQILAGHESPVTTAKYDRRGDDVRRAAVESRAMPGRGGG
jgi:integrase